MQPGPFMQQKTCPKGHKYLAQLVACPFCARETGMSGGRPKLPPQKTVVIDAPPIVGGMPGGLGGGAPVPGGAGVRKTRLIDGDEVAPAADHEPAFGEEEGLEPLGALVCLKGVFMGAEFPLYPSTESMVSRVRIGSAESCEVSFPDDPDMEPLHAEVDCVIRRGESIFILLDKSESGTYMNADPTPVDVQELIDGDRLLCGSTIFEFRLYR